MIILHEKKDCIVKEIEWSEVKTFLNMYHKQGAGKPTNINYGLYNKTVELVGIATFAECRFKYSKLEVDYEWMRLCYKTDVIVKGGTQKLLNTFLERYGGNLISYQFESFEGNMFEGLGFELISKRKSDIYYNPTTGKETRHRFINDKKDVKLQEYLKNNPEKSVADYFGYTEVRKDMICYTWYRKATPIGYIYKITSPEGKSYVGLKKSSTFVNSYWSSSQNKDYWNDLNKFGKEAFTREVLEWCYTLSELNERETYWIKECKSTVDNNGYNICISFPQIIRTEEVKQKLKEANDKYWSNPENRKVLGDKIKNSKKYQESRKTVGKVISTGLKNLSPEEKRIKYAFTQTEEFKDKIRTNNTGKHWYNDEQNNIFAYECPEGYVPGMLETAAKGRSFSEEHKKKLSEVKAGLKWYTNGINSIQADECPGEGWYLGRIVIRKEKKNWWNNGKEQCQSVECPGKGWKEGRLVAWHPECGIERFIELCKVLSLGELATFFDTSIATIRSYKKRNNIKDKKGVKSYR